MKFPYTILAPDACKPLIPMRLCYEKTHKVLPSNIMALVDSGADVCFCSEDIAFWLGSRPKGKSTKEFTAANNQTFKTYKETFKLMTCGKVYECDFYVSSSLPKVAPIILGQSGFFDKFQVNFDLQKKEIDII